MKEKDYNKVAAICYIVAAICFFIVAIMNILDKETSTGVINLALGSSFSCLSCAFFTKAKEDNKNKKNK